MGIISSVFGCKAFQPSIDSTDTIVYFSLTNGGGMRMFDGFRYKVELTKDGRAHFVYNEEYPDEKQFTIDDLSVFDSLQQIVMKHKMYKYSGHYDPMMRIDDGKSWHLSVRYVSGKDISAGGYMAGPKGYWDAFNDIIRCLDQWRDTPAEVNEVVYFDYVFGPTHYHVERQDDHTVMTIDDSETGEHQVIERSLNMMEDLRIMLNIYRLNEDYTLKTDDPEATLWYFEVLYANGDKYRHESYEKDFRSGDTYTLQRFVNDWKEAEVENLQYRYF